MAQFEAVGISIIEFYCRNNLLTIIAVPLIFSLCIVDSVFVKLRLYFSFGLLNDC